MRWTATGLEAILNLRLVKYADPDHYQAFLAELFQNQSKQQLTVNSQLRQLGAKV